MTGWDELPAGLREAMSREFWEGLTDEERKERLRYPLDRISDEARDAYQPEEPDGPR